MIGALKNHLLGTAWEFFVVVFKGILCSVLSKGVSNCLKKCGNHVGKHPSHPSIKDVGPNLSLLSNDLEIRLSSWDW